MDRPSEKCPDCGAETICITTKLTRRDYFAAAAIGGLWAANPGHFKDPGDIAQAAFEIADAMEKLAEEKPA